MYTVPFNIFNYTDNIFCILNERGIIVRINNAFTQLLGYDTEEVAGKSIFDYFHPADRTRYAELSERLIQQGTSNIYAECRVRVKDGRFYTVGWSIVYNKIDKLIFALGSHKPENSSLPNPGSINTSLQEVIQSFTEGFLMLDTNWRIQSYNPAFQAISGLSAAKLKNADIRHLRTFAITAEVETALKYAFTDSVQVQVQYHEENTGRWLRANVYPLQQNLVIFIRDITSTKIPQLVLALEKKVLEMNAMQPNSLAYIVETLLEGIEIIFPEMICSVLELDKEQEHIKSLASPRLPAEYTSSINNLAIGPNIGTCGAAAYHRRQMMDVDLATSERWENYRHLALPFGLRSCCSTPVISSNSSKVLATFAVYYKKPREPQKEELQIIERAINILRVLIESRRNLEHVNEQNKRLQEIASVSSHDLRRPVATILGLVNLFDVNNPNNVINAEIISHLRTTAAELDDVIHTIVKRTMEI